MQRRATKLVIVLPRLARGGMERSISRVLASLSPERFSTWIVALDGPGPCTPLDETDCPGAKLLVLDRKTTDGVDYSLFGQLEHLLREVQPDIVHTHNWASALYGIVSARRAGVPHVVHAEHGRELTHAPPIRRRVLARLARPMVDRFAAVCFDLAKEVETVWGTGAKDVHLLYNGIDLAEFELDKEREEHRRATRQDLGLPEGAFVVGSLAMFREVKDVPTMLRGVLRARQALRARGEDRELVLALIGAMERGNPEIETLLNADPSAFRLLSLRRDGPQVLAALDAYLNTSRYEGLSLAILEAMAARLPIIATRVGGTPEVIADRQTGLLVPAAAPDEVAAALLSLVRAPDRARVMGEAARSMVESRFTIEATVRRYQEFYEGLEVHPRPAERLLRALGRAVGGRAA